jgi:putative transferase (TIGR04331 family)
MNKKICFLILTPLGDIRRNVKKVYLGEWCKLYNKKEYFLQNTKVISYHWSSQSKFERDLKYINLMYELLLKELSKKLNEIHNVNHSEQYWRIVIGPWLFDFIAILFDRWEVIKSFLSKRNKCSENKKIIAISVFYKKENFIYSDYENFIQNVTTDCWNNFIFSELISKYTNIPLKKVLSRENNELRIFKLNWKKNILNYVNKLTGFFVKKKDIFIILPYFKYYLNILLQLKFKQFPFLWQNILSKKYRIDWNKREWKKWAKLKNKNFFLSMIHDLIPSNIPMIYIEGYKNSVLQSQNTSWPKYPKFIFTSVSYINDDLFKIWVAEKKKSRTKLIIGQHGGAMFISKHHNIEEHSKKIADKVLTWGYSEKNNKKIVSGINFSTPINKIKSKTNGSILFINYQLPRYTENIDSVYKGPLALNYHKEKIIFFKNLNYDALSSVVINTKKISVNYQWFENLRFKDRGLELNFSNDTLINDLKKSALCVTNLNATSFLHVLNINFPTIIFFNKLQLRGSALLCFKKLNEAGIYFNNSIDAAKHINNIWPNIDVWWRSKKVQSAVLEFTNKYSRRTETLANDLYYLFKKF